MGCIVVVLAGAMFLFVLKAQKDEPAAKQTGTGTVQGKDAVAVSGRNTDRKTDAARLLASVANYVSDNSGQLPREITSTMLAELKMYTAVPIVPGAQSPVTTDQLRLVVGAECAEGGSTAAAGSRAYAVQLGLEQVGGGFKPDCRNY